MTDSQIIQLQGTRKELMQLIPQMAAMRQLIGDLDVSGSAINENFDPGRRYHPLVKLCFLEDSSFRPGTNQPKGQGQNRVYGRLSFRLMEETTETLSEGNLKALGEKIKQAFGGDGGYVWQKGKELYCYADWSRGYQMTMLTKTQLQAEQLVIKILGLQGHTPIWKYLSKSQNTREAERYPLVPQTKVILGEPVRLPLQRPNVEVRFRYAEVRVSPLMRAITVYDRTGKRVAALVR